MLNFRPKWRHIDLKGRFDIPSQSPGVRRLLFHSRIWEKHMTWVIAFSGSALALVLALGLVREMRLRRALERLLSRFLAAERSRRRV